LVYFGNMTALDTFQLRRPLLWLSCLFLGLGAVFAGPHAAKAQGIVVVVNGQAITQGDVANRMSARQARWAGMLPKNPADLWDALVAFDADSLAALFAWCVSTGVNALQLPHIRRTRELAHADRLADHVDLDMRRHWSATSKSFFGKVTKSQIIATVREVKGEAVAQMIDHLKKSDMATEAERLVAGANWLPAPLRSTYERGSHALVASSGTTVEVPVQPASEGSEDANPAAITLPAFLTEGLATAAAYPVAAE